MDFYSYYLKHYYYWLNSIYMPSDNEFVAFVDRKKSYGTRLLILHTRYDTTKRSTRYNLVLVVVVLGLGLVVVKVEAAVIVVSSSIRSSIIV